MTSLLIVCGLFLGSVLHVSWRESVFVSACLSLSSTPLVVKFLTPGNDVTHQNKDGLFTFTQQLQLQHSIFVKVQVCFVSGASAPDYASTLLGLLIMQDVLLGVIMALLPVLAHTSSNASHAHAPATSPTVLTADVIVMYVLIVFKLIFGECTLSFFVHFLACTHSFIVQILCSNQPLKVRLVRDSNTVHRLTTALCKTQLEILIVTIFYQLL